MTISSVAMKAYTKALDAQRQAEIRNTMGHGQAKADANPASDFAQTFSASLKKVNDMQMQKGAMIESFASGENTNVHELMIQIQKAGVAINMTSAVRNKILSAYQEIMRMQF